MYTIWSNTQYAPTEEFELIQVREDEEIYHFGEIDAIIVKTASEKLLSVKVQK